MTEEWQYFPCAMGENTAFIFLDVGVAKTLEKAPPTLVTIRLAYKKATPNGLPTDEEFEPVRSIEKALEDFVNETSSWYVGRVTVAGHRHFYVYSSVEETRWWTFLESLSASHGYKLQMALSSDPQHQRYWQELYPTDDDWRVIHDLRVIDALKKEGDDGTAPRQVDHWVYFESEAATSPFLKWALDERFTHDKANSHNVDDGKYCLRLCHEGPATINSISARTIALRRKALEHGGDYDGWETFVIRGRNT